MVTVLRKFSRRYLLVTFAVVIVIVIGGLVQEFSHTSEPSYKGKSYTVWLEIYSTNLFWYLDRNGNGSHISMYSQFLPA